MAKAATNHPDYHFITVQMTDGTTYQTPLDLRQGRRHARAGHRPETHPAWTGASQALLDRGGRVSRFNNRFAGMSFGRK